jgi:short-subunit dehydrogenase
VTLTISYHDYMSRSIAVLGTGQGLGQAVAHRYARGGYDVVLVARRSAPLRSIAADLTRTGANAHVITADLADTAGIPALSRRIRATVGDLDALYYAPTPADSFVAAADLTPERAEAFMPLAVYSLIALVQAFLPQMLDQGDGAILTALGASAVRGPAHMSGPGPAQAAQRNYLQSLHGEVARRGVYIGTLCIGAIIEGSAFHRLAEEARAAGADRDWGPTVSPAHLADVLWTLHHAKGEPEARYPV